jgi:hypothetical protein
MHLVRVVVGLLLDLAAQDGPAPGDLAALQAVEDGGIGLQAHVQAQPIVEHGRHALALVVAAGLLLDDRGEDDRFLPRLDRQILLALRPQPLGQLLGLRSHVVEDRLAIVAARHDKGFGQQRALRRHRCDLARQALVGFQALHDLVTGQAFRHRHLVGHGAPF